MVTLEQKILRQVELFNQGHITINNFKNYVNEYAVQFILYVDNQDKLPNKLEDTIEDFEKYHNINYNLNGERYENIKN